VLYLLTMLLSVGTLLRVRGHALPTNDSLRFWAFSDYLPMLFRGMYTRTQTRFKTVTSKILKHKLRGSES
jgi:hypothetical protein